LKPERLALDLLGLHAVDRDQFAAALGLAHAPHRGIVTGKPLALASDRGAGIHLIDGLGALALSRRRGGDSKDGQAGQDDAHEGAPVLLRFILKHRRTLSAGVSVGALRRFRS
jgi:hypothetical protein